MHNSDDQKAKIKKQAVGGQYQFGAAHGVLNQSPPRAQKSNGSPRSADDLEKYFYALAEAVITEKGLLVDLFKANVDLTATSANFLATVAVLIKYNGQLSHRFGNF